MLESFSHYIFIIGIIVFAFVILMLKDNYKILKNPKKYKISNEEFLKISTTLEELKKGLHNLSYRFEDSKEIVIQKFGENGFDISIQNEEVGFIVYGTDGWHSHIDFFTDRESKEHFLKKAMEEIIQYMSSDFRIVEIKAENGFLKSAEFQKLENGEWPTKRTQTFLSNPFSKHKNLVVKIWSNSIVSTKEEYEFVQQVLKDS